jgi:hypothetical protein
VEGQALLHTGPARPDRKVLAVKLMIVRFVPALALTAALLTPSAVASTAPRLATPDLLDRAVATGSMDRATADLYLAYAFSNDERLPDRYVSKVPWDGTLPLLGLRERLKSMRPGPARSAVHDALDPVACFDAVAGPDTHDSTFFHIHYDDTTLDPSLTIGAYAASLDTAWTTEIANFGWAAPPLDPGFTDYPVVVADLGAGLYGFVFGTTVVGNNPSTPWNDIDAQASCMALNEDYTGFPGTPQQALDATTAHEFNHSIQFGLGAITGPNAADDMTIEAGATWMEDEVFDSADDNHNYLWPDFTLSMGEYDDFPYPYWVVFRALTERYGASTPGGGEEVFQDVWEAISQSLTSVDLAALNGALVTKGTNLPDAYHAAAIALKFNLPCGGGLAYPYCLEEGPAYVANAGPTPLNGGILSPGQSFSGSIEDNYALNWVALPASGSYPVSLQNTSTGGQFRATVACRTASGLALSPLAPATAGPGATISLASLDTGNCTQAPVAVITNQSQTSPNPPASMARSYTLTAGSVAPPLLKGVALKAKPKKVDQGDKTRLTATVSVCDAGDPVDFFRGSKKVRTKPTNAACVATHRVAVPRTSKFKAVSTADDDGGTGTSNQVKVKVRKP